MSSCLFLFLFFRSVAFCKVINSLGHNEVSNRSRILMYEWRWMYISKVQISFTADQYKYCTYVVRKRKIKYYRLWIWASEFYIHCRVYRSNSFNFTCRVLAMINNGCVLPFGTFRFVFQFLKKCLEIWFKSLHRNREVELVRGQKLLM